ncbi:DUF4493 domain-containing protein [Bacteroides caecigallinarum]|uniref:DUF4493 domain-containing protein n=1 Tax=Bacteroides caecigallinarum TaxID=1411144 RepID=UPI00195C5AE4|nr:DUF4493 domain-containing protein [Bacteroides caecigallinarum]MBM6960289.1 DUF4493 domain-containing protein [Bacteroides caecigallinarum]
MKIINYLKVFCLLLLIAGFCSCSNGANESVSGQGAVMIDLLANLSYSRSIDESVYRDVNNYKVSLYKGEEPVYTDKLYSELEVEQKVDFGVPYTVTAYYGEDVAAGYDKLYVKGSETFTVSQGDKKTVSIVCKPANARIILVYKGNDDTDTFEDYFQDCTVTVKTDYMNEVWTMNKSNENQQLYLKTGDEGVKAVLSFSLIDKNGEPVSVDDFNTSKTIDLKPCYSYTLTIKPNATDIEGGKLGLEITVDDGVTEEDVTVDIPGDYIPS